MRIKNLQLVFEGLITKQRLASLARQSTPLILSLTVFSVMAFAQSDPFSAAAQGGATAAISTAKWLGIALCAICGVTLMTGETHAASKIMGLFVGLVFALFSSPIVTWVQSL